jgi:hypothetical protein
VTARRGDDHSDVDAVNADVNRVLQLLRIFLGTRERTRAVSPAEDEKSSSLRYSTHWSQWMPFESFHETLEE